LDVKLNALVGNRANSPHEELPVRMTSSQAS
jgi:hypothetical protein